MRVFIKFFWFFCFIFMSGCVHGDVPIYDKAKEVVEFDMGGGGKQIGYFVKEVFPYYGVFDFYGSNVEWQQCLEQEKKWIMYYDSSRHRYVWESRGGWIDKDKGRIVLLISRYFSPSQEVSAGDENQYIYIFIYPLDRVVKDMDVLGIGEFRSCVDMREE